MDAAAAFLHRKERHAMAKRRKGEPLRVLVPVVHGDRTGLLAITPTRVLYASRRRLGTKVQQWPRRRVPLRLERRGYGILRVGRLRFELMGRDEADAVAKALAPARGVRATFEVTGPTRQQVPQRGPASPAQARPAARPVRIDRPPDPLAHRGTAEHQARLRRMHAKGMLSKAELEWQLER